MGALAVATWRWRNWALRVEGPSLGHPTSKQGSWAPLGSPGNASWGIVLAAATEVQIQGFKEFMS